MIKRIMIAVVASMTLATAATASERTIDISGNNTSSSYVSYSTSFSIASGNVVNVKMARYCYFSSTITGKGMLNLYAGGERCYLGTEKGKTWPNWTNFTGDIHIYPFKENSSSAGFYGVVLAHGGKSSTAENALDDAKSGKVNPSMANNHVTLHDGATICCEANTSGAGFRIGELQTEAGSTLQGYMKKSRAAYYLLGGLNTDFTLAGTIKPSDYDDATLMGIVKEGTGTMTITGNNNCVSGALRILAGRVQVSNDCAEAEQKKLRGALGARPNTSDAIAYVFENGLLGGTGSIGGTVDNYGTVEPGDFEPNGDVVGVTTGTLTLRNYVTASKQPNLCLRPASKLRFKIVSATDYDRLDVGGSVKYNNIAQDFSESDKMPIIEISLLNEMEDMQIGDEFTLLTAKEKTGDWQFELKQPSKYTWELVEEKTDGAYTLKARIVSLNNSDDPDNPENPYNPDDPDVPVMGPYYDDGIDDTADTKTLRYYAEECGKYVGVALCTYKGYQSDREEACRQFNMMVAENEMKMDALQPSQGQFSFGGADNLVSLARSNNMAIRGHCLVWHQQQPQWLSSDGKKNDKNWTRQEALAIMKNHIEKVMSHFKGKVTEWDVVNECLDDDQSIIRSNPEGYTLRQTVWQRAIGDDYIDSAFVYAHRADPSVVLYLNDYDVELQGKAKAVAFRNLAMRLKNRGIPIDGVGLQCHFSVGEVDSVKLASTVQRFGQDGLKCVITELDMGIPSTTSANLQEQARIYRVITDIMLANDNCPYMVIWGVKDNDSWRSASSPLLFDSGMGKKPAWRAVRSALRHHSISTTTGVGRTVAFQPSVEYPVYDLQGRRVNGQPRKAGIYIYNGKKIVVK
ncbi:MAG: endo-1,4-beta-xylanase [Prevotella sp.]|nr:endo-1,4-beta-xylanase [Prevotella sp.]